VYCIVGSCRGGNTLPEFIRTAACRLFRQLVLIIEKIIPCNHIKKIYESPNYKKTECRKWSAFPDFPYYVLIKFFRRTSADK
jgi:hypothetical protein